MVLYTARKFTKIFGPTRTQTEKTQGEIFRPRDVFLPRFYKIDIKPQPYIDEPGRNPRTPGKNLFTYRRERQVPPWNPG